MAPWRFASETKQPSVTLSVRRACGGQKQCTHAGTVGAADAEFGAVVEREHGVAAGEGRQSAQVWDSDKRLAMDADEAFGIDHLIEPGGGLAQEVRAAVCVKRQVIALRLNPA